jgi:hypothetical protein
MVASWVIACPLRTACSECGYEIDIGRLLSVSACPPRWSFEHSPRLSIIALFRTSWRCFAPPRLWSGFQPEHDVRLVRLAIFTAVWLLIAHTVAAITLAVAFLHGPRAQFGIATLMEWKTLLPIALWPYRTLLIPIGPNTWTDVRWWPLLGLTLWPALLMPLLVVAQVRTGTIPPPPNVRHLMRAVAYSLPGALAALLLLVGALIIFSIAIDGEAVRETFDWLIAAAFIFALLFFPVAIAWWWTVFLRCYLQALGANRAGFRMVVASTLSAVIMCVIIAALAQA